MFGSGLRAKTPEMRRYLALANELLLARSREALSFEAEALYEAQLDQLWESLDGDERAEIVRLVPGTGR